eukprot:151930_1
MNKKVKPSLPHLMRNQQSEPKMKTKITRTHSHDTIKHIHKDNIHNIHNNNNIEYNNNKNNNNNEPLFHQIQHDLNSYIQRFLFNASKKYWYSNEYSLSRDMIACTPLTTNELMEIHKKSYMESILNDDIRVTNKRYIYMIDARIGATFDKVYNGIYGIFQTFIDKNNHISYIYNDKLVCDKISQINLLNIIKNNINWKQYSQKLIKELNKQLIGPYKSYAMDKFKKLLQLQFKTLSTILFIYNINNNNNNNNNN